MGVISVDLFFQPWTIFPWTFFPWTFFPNTAEDAKSLNICSLFPLCASFILPSIMFHRSKTSFLANVNSCSCSLCRRPSVCRLSVCNVRAPYIGDWKFRQYIVSPKNIPDVFSYNSRKHCRIFIIFVRNITKKASNQNMLYFSTSPN